MTINEGVWIQIYRDKVPNRDVLARKLDEFKSLGCPGVAMHGFTHELPDRFESLAQMCNIRGLECMAAFGMNSQEPRKKGERIARVARMPTCYAVVLDAEGAWEDEDADKQHAEELSIALHSGAPGAVYIDQPWFAPLVHWSRFPWEEFARCVNYRAPQVYCNNFTRQYGRDRYKIIWQRYEREWKKLESRLGELTRPRFPTIQGYAWILSDLVDCLCKNPAVLMWCEPFPDNVATTALRVRQALAGRNFNGPSAVRDFQKDAHITVDGIVGRETMRALGLQPSERGF